MELFIDTDIGKRLATPTQVFQGIKTELTWPRNFELADAAEARDLLQLHYSPTREAEAHLALIALQRGTKIEDHMVVFFLSEKNDVIAFQSLFIRSWQLSLITAGGLMDHAYCYGAKRVFFVRVSSQNVEASRWDDMLLRRLRRLAGDSLQVDFAALDLNYPDTEPYGLDAELAIPFYVKPNEEFRPANRFAVTNEATQLSLARLVRGQALYTTQLITAFAELCTAPIAGVGIYALLMSNSLHLLHFVKAADTLDELAEDAQSILTPAQFLSAEQVVLVVTGADDASIVIPDGKIRRINRLLGFGLEKALYVRASPAGAKELRSFHLQ